jgi:hypothetical protein
VTAEAIDRADQLLAMSARLIRMIREEAAAMKSRALDRSTPAFEEKERLTHAYRLEAAAVRADPGLLAGARADQIEALARSSLELEAALAEHTAALTGMKRVTEGLVRAIAAEIGASRAAPSAYGRSGQVVAGSGREAAGIALNAKA